MRLLYVWVFLFAVFILPNLVQCVKMSQQYADPSNANIIEIEEEEE
jgi:hypothetical protein